MNWFKENKFVAGLLIVLVLGVGALVYLWLGASARLEEANTAYESQVNERTRLHNLKPYPSPENVKTLVAQKDEATAKIIALHRALAGAEFPVEAMTPVKFQDSLRAAVTAVKEAAGAGTKLPDKFFLGFDRYETTTPDATAAPYLGRELKAIQWLVGRFIEAKTAEIRALERDPLPAESGKEPAEKPVPPPARGGKPAKAEIPVVPLVVPHAIDLKVFGEPAGLRAVLNQIAENKEQFFIIRRLSFVNEKEKAPARVVEGGATPGAAPADPADPAAPARSGPASTYIVGTEKVELNLRVEMVDFVDPPKPGEKPGTGPK